MFSTLSNFLPASLQPTSPAVSSEPTHYETDDDDTKSVASAVGGIPDGGKKKKGKGPHETFIVVRPPPAKSNHPLNLQVQLVPPQGTRSVSVSSAVGDGDTGSRRTSIDSGSEGGAPLSRSSSISSSYAGPSESTTSVNSTSTTASNLSSRRAIVPLYNLQAHNVMTNVVIDAGTDAKIAKFQRRGLEMVDLGILDCVEVWPSDKDKETKPPRTSLDAASATSRPLLKQTHSGQATPASSAVSLSSAGHSHLTHEPPEINITPIPESSLLSPIPGTPNDSPVPPSSPQPKKNIFGKLFSKRDKEKEKGSGTPPTSPLPRSSNEAIPRSPSPAKSGHLRTTSQVNKEDSIWKRHSKNLSMSIGGAPSPRTSRHSRPSSFIEPSATEFGAVPGGDQRSESPSIKSRRNSLDPGGHPPSTPQTATTTVASDGALLRPAVLGLQPSCTGNPTPAGKRVQILYVWTMRKWIKGADNSLFTSLLSGAFSARDSGFRGEGGSNITAREGEDANGSGSGGKVELRFEWRRSLKAQKKKKTKGSQDRPTTSGGASTKSGRRKSLADDPLAEGEEDGGEESDPEDSETPWVCTVKVRRANIPGGTPPSTQGATLSPTPSRLSANPPSIGSAAGRNMKRLSNASLNPAFVDDQGAKERESKTIKLKVATLSPTPHHPKVVGMLKIPYPLSDFDFSPSLPGGVVLRKRSPGKPGEALVSPDGAGGLPKGFTLTAEEIKDVVSVSALWLIVREGFGGVGKEKRKGDGWKLRG